MNGARAVDLCQQAGASGQWGVMEAAYVRANGSNATPPNPITVTVEWTFSDDSATKHSKSHAVTYWNGAKAAATSEASEE